MAKKKYYINNVKFYSAITSWIDEGRPEPVNDYLTNAIVEIIWRIATRKNFRYYPYLEDMKGEAAIHCLKALKTYKREKDNPYGYFTTCVHNAFFQYIKKENKFIDFKFHTMQDEIDSSLNMDRSIIVGYNRNSNGDCIDENGNILTTVEELREKKNY